MIHHISIAAHHPLRVAQVLAELWQGQCVPFPEHEGSYVAIAFDTYGTMIEVHPHGTELRPGSAKAAVQHVTNSQFPTHTPVHAAVSVPVSEAQIRAVAAREGWRVVRCNRGSFFEVIEVWIENQQLLELLPPSLTAKYLAFMQPKALKQFLTAAAS